MINTAINTFANSPQILLDTATTVLPQTAYNTANSVAGVPISAYDYVNGMTGYDIGTTVLGVGMMAIAGLTDIIPYAGSLDDPILYPGGAAFLYQASENKPIPEAAECIFIDGVGGAVRRIVPYAEKIVPEKTTDPMAYLGFGLLAGAVTVGASVVALKLGDVI